MARRAAIDEVRPVLEELDKVTEVVDKGLDAIEKGTDVGVHAAVEEVRTAVHWLRSPKTAAIVLIVVNVAGAGFVGWKLAKRHYTKKFEAEMEMEIEQARKFYGRLNKLDENGETLTPEELVKKHATDDKAEELFEEAAEALENYQSPVIPENRPVANGRKAYNRVVAEDVVVTETKDGLEATGTVVDASIFDARPEEPRDPERPYVISQEEFLENDPEHTQTSITYYAGDDILADERDVPIDEVESTVGTDNLSRFGHGSKDKHLVYIRNERTEMDFEIAYSGGKFAEEVHGFIEHSDRPVIRKMRTERE